MIGSFFSEKGIHPIIIERNRIIPEQQIVICEDGIRFCDTDIIKDQVAAIILDSGYMWPNPVLKPSIEMWERYRNNQDEYLRKEGILFLYGTACLKSSMNAYRCV